MLGLKTSFIAFFGVLQLASVVRGQTDLTFATCDNSIVGGGRGARFTTYEILCGTDESGTALSSPVSVSGASFTTLCSLLDEGAVSFGGNTIDLRAYLDDSANPHTIFAPTDAAFAEIQSTVDDVLDLKTTDPTAFNRILVGWLQLHILGDTYLETDFECEEVYMTINLSTLGIFDQKQKTKCRNEAAYFDQIGVGNIGFDMLPTVGLPADVFNEANFDIPNTVLKKTLSGTGLSSNVIGCNGVIHVVDTVLLPSDYGNFYYGSKGGYYAPKSSKGTKGGWRGYGYRYRRYNPYFYRNLGEEEADEAAIESEGEFDL